MKKQLFIILAVALLVLVGCSKQTEAEKFVGTYDGTVTSSITMTDNLTGEVSTSGPTAIPLQSPIVFTLGEDENTVIFSTEGMSIPAVVSGNKITFSESAIENLLGVNYNTTMSGTGELNDSQLILNTETHSTIKSDPNETDEIDNVLEIVSVMNLTKQE